ncbi:hypothetical protein [uncultured Sphingomonas sp.]|uniref:hypothetical protein n=1 Tax=uncultured Sphingomonas sp. TaxID=158754 RepID=UPI0035CACC5C
MDNEKGNATQAAAGRVVELEEEVEASGIAVVEGDELAWARGVLHQWIDDMTGVVVSPGLGRVTVIHGNGRTSSIGSPTLPFLMSRPVGPRRPI